jgi:hypothetical protein
MSFIDNLFSTKTLGGLATAAIAAYALNQTSASTKTETTKPTPTPLDPSTESKIPVIYGQAFVQGLLTDAKLLNNNQTMTFVLTLCERTGKLDLGRGADSTITFSKIYWENQLVYFQPDGITVDYIVDSTGAINRNVSGLIKIQCYNNGSTAGTNTNIPAYSVVPGWTSSYTMNNLVFAVVTVTYNKDKGVDKLGNMKFYLTNTMTQPGDCLYDYMTNPIYGAGIDPSEVNM